MRRLSRLREEHATNTSDQFRRRGDAMAHCRRGVNVAQRIGELSTRSELFRTLWASHDVREHRTGLKRIHHPVVGDLDLNYEGMNLTADRGLLLLAYTAEPGSPSHERLQLLATWAATSDEAGSASPVPTDATDGA